MNYSKYLTQTPQNLAIPGEKMIPNNAGGFGFEISPQKQLERFLVLGTEGGTYYVGEAKLTVDNASTIIALIKANGVAVVDTLIQFKNRVPKADTLLFTLALVATYGDDKAKAASYNAIATLCSTPTQLFTFVENVNAMRGWSRGLRTGVAKFYTNKSAQDLAYAVAKYRQRNGWTHKDVLRLAHPTARTEVINGIFKYAVGKASASDTGVKLLIDFEAAQAATSGKELAKLIQANSSLTWEMVPTQLLNDKDVLAALVVNMPYTATMRNLNRLTTSGLLEGRTSDITKLVVSRLTSEEAISKSGVHPINILSALTTYSKGRSVLGRGTWTPNQAVVDALDSAFELAFWNVEVTGKNILLGVDVSGSMRAESAKVGLEAREIAAAMMTITLKTEPNVEVIYFDTVVKVPKVGKRSSYEEILKSMGSGGGTNLSLPIMTALESRTKYDAVVTYTDNETWSGQQHPVQAFKALQAKNPNVKGITVASTANNVDVLPATASTLGVAGFDSSVPELVSNFIKGVI